METLTETKIKKLIKKTKNEIEMHRTHKRVYRRSLKEKIRDYYEKRKRCDYYLKECSQKLSNLRNQLKKIKQEKK
jgi:hypothetical protein